MSKTMVFGAVLGASLVTALGAVANYQAEQKINQPVQILSSKPLVEHYSVTEQQCKNVTRTRQKEVKDQQQLTGTAIGAVVGGVLGSQIGGGDGKKLATIAGAVAGGYGGKKTQQQMQQDDVEQYQEQVCSPVSRTKEKVKGYEIRFMHDGKLITAQVDNTPSGPLYWNGDRLTDSPSKK